MPTMNRFLPILLCSVPAFGLGQETSGKATESQQYAFELLMQMTEYVAAQDAYSVEVLGGFDVVQEDGRKVQFIEARSILLDRPSHLRISESGAENHGQSVLFDGETVTVWNENAGVFAQAPQPETVDDAIIYFIRELGMRLPLAPVLTTWAPIELGKRVQTIDYVELTHALGVPAHHLSARTADLDFQVWITDGEAPLLLRMVLTYHDVGEPQYWAQFSDWNLQPQFAPGTFELNLPQGVQQIAFAVQMPPLAAEPAETAAPEGDRQ